MARTPAVLVGQLDVPPALLQVDRLYRAEEAVLDRKRAQVRLPHVAGEGQQRAQPFGQLGVDCTQVLQGVHRRVEQLHVDHLGEAQVEDHAVIDREADEDAHELELAVKLERVLVEPVVATVFVVDEHAFSGGFVEGYI